MSKPATINKTIEKIKNRNGIVCIPCIIMLRGGKTKEKNT